MILTYQDAAELNIRELGIRRVVRPLLLVAITIMAMAFGDTRVNAADHDTCQGIPATVIELSHGSRYKASSKTKGVVDAKRNAAVNASLAPVDDFIRILSREANRASKHAGASPNARCAIHMLARWAEDDGLSRLSKNAEMTIGARLAGIVLSYSQVSQYASAEERRLIDSWIGRRLEEQVAYWDSKAPRNARRGNLKAWAALAVLAGAVEQRNHRLLHWAHESTLKILCSVDADGALPREMERGERALHYQIHALAPLVSSVALFERHGISVKNTCNEAIKRAVWYAVRDLDAGGALSQKKSGKRQSYFTGRDTLKPYQFAFGASYLSFSGDQEFAFWLRRFGSLNYSKLGGDQRVIW